MHQEQQHYLIGIVWKRNTLFINQKKRAAFFSFNRKKICSVVFTPHAQSAKWLTSVNIGFTSLLQDEFWQRSCLPTGGTVRFWVQNGCSPWTQTKATATTARIELQRSSESRVSAQRCRDSDMCCGKMRQTPVDPIFQQHVDMFVFILGSSKCF